MAENNNLGGLFYTLGLDDTEFEKKMKAASDKWGVGLTIGAKLDDKAINNSIKLIEDKINKLNLSVVLDDASYGRVLSKLENLKRTWANFKEIKINVSDKETNQGIANIKKPVVEFLNELNKLSKVKLNPISSDALRVIKNVTSELKSLDKILDKLSKYNVRSVNASSINNARVNEVDSRTRNAELLAQQRLQTETLRTQQAQERLNRSRAAGTDGARNYNSSLGLINKTMFNQQALMSQVGGMMAGVFSVYAVQRFVKHLADVRGEFEMQQVSLRAILQNAAAADKIFNQLKDLSVISPYAFKDLVGYAKQLSAFSIPIHEVYDTTKKLADVSSGLGVDMSRIILAYGQIRSASVLRGQELRQLTEAGIPVIDELIKKYAELGEVVSAGDIFDKISNREISFDMIKEMFDEMTKEGGKFYNMQEIQSMSLKGKIMNLADAFDIMFNSIGEENDGLLKGSVDSVAKLAENWQDVWMVMKSLIIAYGIYKGVAMAVGLVNGFTIGQLRQIVTAKQAVDKAMSIHPNMMIGGAAAALGILIGLYATWSAHQDRMNEELMESVGAISKQTQSINELFNSLKKLSVEEAKNNKIINDTKDATTENKEATEANEEATKRNKSIIGERIAALKQMAETEPIVSANISKHADNLDKLTLAQERYNKLAKMKEFATYLANDGSGIISDNLLEDLKDLQDATQRLNKANAVLGKSYNKIYDAVNRFTMKGEDVTGSMSKMNKETLVEVNKIIAGTATATEKLQQLKDLSQPFGDKALKGDQRSAVWDLAQLIDSDDWQELWYANHSHIMALAEADNKLGEFTDNLKVHLSDAKLDLVENAEEIRVWIKSWEGLTKAGQEKVLLNLGIDWDGENDPKSKLDGWRKELFDIVDTTIEIKIDTDMDKAISDMRKKYKETKDYLESMKPILVKAGFDFDTGSLPSIITDPFLLGTASNFNVTKAAQDKLTTASKKWGFTLEDNKKKAGNQKDKIVEGLKKQIDLIKEAYGEYKKLQDIMSKEEALASVKKQDRYKGLDIPVDEAGMLVVIDEFYQKAKKRSTDDGKKMADSLQKELSTGAIGIIKETFDKMSKTLEHEMDSFKKKYDSYERLLSAGASKEEAISLSFGAVGEDGTDLGKFLEGRVKELAKLSKFELDFSIDKGNIEDQLGAVYKDLTPELKRQIDQLEDYRVKKMENSYLAYLKLMNTEVGEGRGVAFDFSSVMAKLSNDSKKLKTELEQIFLDPTNKLSEKQKADLKEHTDLIIESQNREAANKLKNIGAGYLEESLKNKQLWNDYSRMGEASYVNLKKIMEEISKIQEDTFSEKGMTKLFSSSKLVGEKATAEDNAAFSPILGELGSMESIEELEAAVVAMLDNINQAKEGTVALDERMSGLNTEQIQKLTLMLTLIQHISQSLKGATVNVKVADLKRTLKGLNDLKQEIDTLVDSVIGVGDAFGFAFDDGTKDVLNAISVIGTATLGVVAKITAFTDASGQAMKASAITASESVKTVEKASVILAVISAALQIATAIANIFTGNKTRKADEAIKKQTERVKELNRAYERMNKTQEEHYNLVADDASINKWLEMERKKIKESTKGWMFWSEQGQMYIKSLYDAAERKAEGMKGMSWLEVEMENMKQQKEALESAIRSAEGDNKKGKRNDEISGYKDQIADLEEKMIDVRKEWNEMLRGFDMSSAANDFAEAWVDAFMMGESAMDDFKEHFDDMLKQMVINQAALRVVSGVLKPWFDQIDGFFGDDGVLSADEAASIADAIPALLANLDESMTQVIAPLLEAMGMGFGSSSEKGDALKEGIQGVTEETATLLASLLNAIRQDVSVQTSLLVSIHAILEQGGNGSSSGLMLAEMQAMNQSLTTLIANLNALTSSGHPMGGKALKVFA